MDALTGAALMFVLGTYYFLKKKTDRRKALCCKAAATAIPGVLILLRTDDIYNGSVLATLAAIVFYMAADVLLECRFVCGAVCFSIGHICMIAGFLLGGEVPVLTDGSTGVKVLLMAIPVFVIFTGSACIVLHRYFRQMKQKKLFYPMLAYMTVLGIMSSMAVAAGVYGGENSGLASAAGGICFGVSDILLGRNRLGRHRSRICGAFVLILYYLSVYLFAMRFWI